jgi:hypothetical protein
VAQREQVRAGTRQAGRRVGGGAGEPGRRSGGQAERARVHRGAHRDEGQRREGEEQRERMARAAGAAAQHRGPVGLLEAAVPELGVEWGGRGWEGGKGER